MSRKLAYLALGFLTVIMLSVTGITLRATPAGTGLSGEVQRMKEKQTRQLTRQDFAFLKKGMSYQAVYAKVGPPAAEVGSGFMILAYNLKDNTKMILNFGGGDALFMAYIAHPDGVREIIIQ
jgi:hypothetical protein